MSPELVNSLIYTSILLGVFLVAFGGLYLKKKFNIHKEDMEFMALVLSTVDYITSKTTFTYKVAISNVVQYIIQAIEFIDMYEDIEDETTKKQKVKETALQICADNGIEVDDKFVVIVDDIIDYILLYVKEVKKD